MFSPNLLPWVEDRRKCSIFRVQARKVGAFPPITVQTCKGEVVNDGPPAVLEGDYMVYLMREWSVILVQPTVLART